MRAVVIEQPGDPDVLVEVDLPEPEPGPDEVVVDVVATAVNRADLLERRGLYPGPRLTYGGQVAVVPGLEYAGRVAAVGERVAGARVGDEVMGIVAGGSYAQRLVTHERTLLPVPGSVGLPDAAAIPEVFLTAWDALVLHGGMTAGSRVLVHAGASGVGTAAIQLARAAGAEVAVTASAAKHQACRDLGADLTLDRHDVDGRVGALRRWSGGRGVDVVLDVVGGDELARNVEALAVGGRIVQVGVMGGGQATFPLGALLPKRATLVGTVLRARPLEEKIILARRFGKEVVPLFERGALRPVVHERIPLARAADAHRLLEADATVGKVLLLVAAS